MFRRRGESESERATPASGAKRECKRGRRGRVEETATTSAVGRRQRRRCELLALLSLSLARFPPSNAQSPPRRNTSHPGSPSHLPTSRHTLRAFGQVSGQAESKQVSGRVRDLRFILSSKRRRPRNEATSKRHHGPMLFLGGKKQKRERSPPGRETPAGFPSAGFSLAIVVSVDLSRCGIGRGTGGASESEAPRKRSTGRLKKESNAAGNKGGGDDSRCSLEAKMMRHARLLNLSALFLCSSAQVTSSSSSTKGGQGNKQPGRTGLAHSQICCFFYFLSSGRRRRRFVSVVAQMQKLLFLSVFLSLFGAKKTKRILPRSLLAPPRARCAGAGGWKVGAERRKRRSRKCLKVGKREA